MTDPIEDPTPAEPETLAPQEDSQEPEKETAPQFTPITSQDALDKLMGARLAKVRAQFAGAEDWKAKAAKYDELEDAKKTNEQRLTERLQALETENNTLKLGQMRVQAARDAGLPPSWAKRLSGSTPEELAADAADMAEDLPKSEPKTPLTQKPKESLRGGGRPDETRDDEIDIDKIIAKIPRR
ncbi:hypothetical protein [Nocardia sp. NBC_00511]|uniref:hypothetical protein n=1 Tax=Nocardia sp. NBC_00511 TaxID=2903591 RepID=UPI0030DF2AD3